MLLNNSILDQISTLFSTKIEQCNIPGAVNHARPTQINQYTTRLGDALRNLSQDILNNKTYFGSDALKELIRTVHWCHQYIKLYEDSTLSNTEAHQEKLASMRQALQLIQTQFNSVVLQSANCWVQTLQIAIAEQPVHTLSKEDFNRLHMEIADLKAYQQHYQNVAHDHSFWIQNQQARAQYILSDIEEKIQCVDSLRSKQSTPIVNQILSRFRFPSFNPFSSFFTQPSVITRQNPSSIQIKPW